MQYNPIKAGSKIKVMVPDYCEITINRPDGSVDIVRNPAGRREINPNFFNTIKAATKKAGRGDIVSYKNYQKESFYTVTASDEAEDSSAQIERIMRGGE